MKKSALTFFLIPILSLTLLVTTLICVVSCDPATFHFDYCALEANVIDISLIDYNNPDAKELFENREGVLPFDFSKMTVLKRMYIGKHKEFLEKFASIEFLMTWRHLDSPNGKCIMLSFADGSFEIIALADGFTCGYNKDGSVLFFIGEGSSIEIKGLADEFFK